LDQVITLSDGRKVTRAEALATRLIVAALGGDLQAIKLIWERIEGRPVVSVDLLGEADVRIIRLPLALPPAGGDEEDGDGK
jgi:hypothetical protein